MALKLEQLVTSEVAPFLGGFCGDFVAGVEQMACSHQYTAKSASTKVSPDLSKFLLADLGE